VPIKHGNMSGPTSQGVADLIATDPNAVWNAATKKIDHSCVQAGTCPGFSQSPRIVPVPVFDPAIYASTGNVVITNIFGFFVERDNGQGVNSSVWGILMTVPAFVDASKGSVGTASGLKTIYLVR